MQKKEINTALESLSREFRQKVKEYFTKYDIEVKLKDLSFSIESSTAEGMHEVRDIPKFSTCHFNSDGQVVCN